MSDEATRGEAQGGQAQRREAAARELTAADPAMIADILSRFLREEIRKAGFERAVLGLSGGIDSSLAAALAVRALGAANVSGVLMPYGRSGLGAESVADAELVARHLALSVEIVDIAPLVDAHFAADPAATPLRRGNFMARMRMAVLFDRSMRDRALVVGTSNKSELLLGYGTLYGDLACALNPLGDLYKTQVRALSRHLGLPEQIIARPPSAELWPGQTDEGELGFTYAEVDVLLHLLVDRRLPAAEVEEHGFAPSFIAEVEQKIRANRFKGRMPLIAKLSGRTAGLDSRDPQDSGI